MELDILIIAWDALDVLKRQSSTGRQHIAHESHPEIVRPECIYGSGKETIIELICSCFDRPVAPSRGQQVKQVMSWMWGVFQNPYGSAEAAGAENVILGGQMTADNVPRWWHSEELFCLLQSNRSTWLRGSTPIGFQWRSNRKT